MCSPTTLRPNTGGSQPPHGKLFPNLRIINFDISLKAGGIISYLGSDTIFLSDLNLEMWGDRVGTLGGQVGGGYEGSSRLEDRRETKGQGETVGGSAQGSIRLTSILSGGSHHRTLWERTL